MNAVDHANPLHDSFCRCPACKPAPADRCSADARHLMRVKVALLIATPLTIALLVFG